MRYPASEKAEIIRLVEASHLPARRTLGKLGIPRATFYRWYDRYLLRRGRGAGRSSLTAGPGLEPHPRPGPSRDRRAGAARDGAEPARTGGALHRREAYFVSEASVYRLLKAHDLITSPAYIVIKAASEFKDKTTAPNQLWQTDFTYLKIIGWGWYYLSTVLDDFSRFIVAWKLCATMRADDVTATLDLALAASGLDQITVAHRPRLLSDNGSSYISADLADLARRQGHAARSRRALPSPDAGQDRALAPDPQEPHPARKLLPARRSRTAGRGLRRALQPCPLPREPRQPDARRRLLRTRPGHPHSNAKGSSARPSTKDACSISCRPPNLKPDEPEPPFLRHRKQSQII